MDAFNLQRFIEAQQEPMYDWVIEELLAGRKKSHWMWFIFPQAIGLGNSHNAQRYAIRSLEEAKEYWNHPILGERLRQCIQLSIDSKKTALELFGKPVDDMKFQSCLTLFIQVDANNPLLKQAIDCFYGGRLDPKTIAIVEKTFLNS